MRTLCLGLLLGVIAVSLPGQTQTRESRDVSIPSDLIVSLNVGLDQTGYHLNSSKISEHLVGGAFSSLSGEFYIKCPNGYVREVDMVVPLTPVMWDSLSLVVAEKDLRPLSIDETIAYVSSAGPLQLSIAKYLISLMRRSCVTPVPAIVSLTLWVGKDGKHYPSHTLIDADRFAALTR